LTLHTVTGAHCTHPCTCAQSAIYAIYKVPIDTAAAMLGYATAQAAAFAKWFAAGGDDIGTERGSSGGASGRQKAAGSGRLQPPGGGGSSMAAQFLSR
jgi:hypothetical protein